jgi:hypothetical protein
MNDVQDEPGWWGGRDRGGDRLSLLDLISNGTLDIRTAAVLWMLVESKSSMIVAAAPQLAGKTTLTTALLDLLPPSYATVLTRGRAEDFSFLADTDPARTYILVPELSDHTPAYLWGDKVATLFGALERGYSVAATMHADTPTQVVDMLMADPVSIPPGRAHHAGAVINLWLGYGERDLQRRLSRLTLVMPGPELVVVGEWDTEADAFVWSASAVARAALSQRLGNPRPSLDAAVDRRVEVLESWLSAGNLGTDGLRQVVAQFYASKASR